MSKHFPPCDQKNYKSLSITIKELWRFHFLNLLLFASQLSSSVYEGGGDPRVGPRGDPWRGPRWLYIRSWLGDASFSKMGNTHRQLYKLHQF